MSVFNCLCGGGGIRTHGTVSRTPVFKTGAFDLSATPPIYLINYKNIKSQKHLRLYINKKNT